MMLSDVWGLSVWRLSVAYIGPKSRTEKPMKTKIGTEVAQVTRDSDTTFRVKRSEVKVTGAGHTVAASRTACFRIVMSPRLAEGNYISAEAPTRPGRWGWKAVSIKFFFLWWVITCKIRQLDVSWFDRLSVRATESIRNMAMIVGEKVKGQIHRARMWVDMGCAVPLYVQFQSICRAQRRTTERAPRRHLPFLVDSSRFTPS